MLTSEQISAAAIDVAGIGEQLGQAQIDSPTALASVVKRLQDLAEVLSAGPGGPGALARSVWDLAERIQSAGTASPDGVGALATQLRHVAAGQAEWEAKARNIW
ncbi:hypothetical protein B7435_30140 [Mycolicibacterium peregrinum]|uniref:Uncharacterized protein n=1 Tax=Mycolicibacterium alvei TaxID=67081 RepID=A0A6N4V015_9MYCO|nr:hypothetical protein [Mycolicibacterium alvei]MCV7003524.1 hypothetical protein [Mycolicibacterium alvei]OWL95548.1 hypothetical protein B7435_30140 [Mycolicibacterium peregrinum]BBX30520.1 hypothetical protein MALV_56450 [Mycolicibacterium alvei]